LVCDFIRLRQGSDPSVSFHNQSPKNKSYGAVSRHGHVSGILSLQTHYKVPSVFSRNTKFQGSKMHATDFRKSCATLIYSYSAIPFFRLFMFISFVYLHKNMLHKAEHAPQKRFRAFQCFHNCLERIQGENSKPEENRESHYEAIGHAKICSLSKESLVSLSCTASGRA
jgi:hypothetical protein